MSAQSTAGEAHRDLFLRVADTASREAHAVDLLCPVTSCDALRHVTASAVR